jgi:hypothetical protein
MVLKTAYQVVKVVIVKNGKQIGMIGILKITKISIKNDMKKYVSGWICLKKRGESRMKKLNEILKPLLIFSVYITSIAFLSPIISTWYNGDIMYSSLMLFMITYPIYLYLFYKEQI